mgnify:CR=1 FL=1
MSVTIYHNPRWGKSRNSVGILNDKGVKYNIIKYIENPPSPSELKIIAKKLNLKAKDFIRKGEQDFKNLNVSEQKLNNDEEMFEIMSENPKIIERPIIVNGNKACIGRPPENILKIL